jgi:putative FmdB family regulatory protein
MSAPTIGRCELDVFGPHALMVGAGMTYWRFEADALPLQQIDLTPPVTLTGVSREEIMPVYEYLCADCSQKFELFVPQRMSTEGVVCGRCHSSSVRKLVSSFAGISADSSGDYAAAAPSTGGGCGCGGNCACGGH